MANSSVQNVEDVVNLALVRIGYPTRIGSIFEGSKASKAALSIYAQTRDELLRQFDWGFAERSVPMVIIKQAPAGGYVPPNMWNPNLHPAPDWLYEITYPTDCIKVRSVQNVPIFVPDFDPQPFQFSVSNDNTLEGESKVILCNVYPGILTYTGQVTAPSDWENDFIEAMASSLGRRLAPLLASIDIEKLEAADESSMTIAAEVIRG
jgi:hypothetical protein